MTMNNFLIIVSAALLILSILTLEVSIFYYVYKFFRQSVIKINFIQINTIIKRFYSIIIRRFLLIIRKIATEAFNINAPPTKRQKIHSDTLSMREVRNG
jgi:hypothetical protein